MGLHVRRLCLGCLVRSKLRTKCAYFSLVLLVILVFLHLSVREPLRLPAFSRSPANMARHVGWKPEDVHQRVVNDQKLVTVERNVRIIGDDTSDESVNGDSNADDREFQNIRKGTRRGFLFAFRYYEQLGRTTDNLIYLASLAKYKDRQVVAPFVNNSRMSGLRGGVSGRKKPTGFRFGNLDEYFDVSQVNARLQSHGYSSLVDFHDFEVHCERELDLVVHFLYAPVARTSSIEDVVSWYKMNHTTVQEIYRRTRENGGWDECTFLRKSKAAKLMGFAVRRYLCVDPEVITSAHELEEKVFNGAQCVGIVQWKGMGEGRTHFPLSPSITRRLRPSDLSFNPQLVQLAKKFVQQRLGDNFIAVHVRTERHLVWKGLNVTLRCIHKLERRIREAQTLYKIPTLFLASDLTDYGSDTLVSDSKSSDRASLSLAIHNSLHFPTTFDPQETGIYDKGTAAIVEMNILAMATRLFTLGGGNFQEWLVDLFLLQNRGRKTRVHRMCEMS